MLVAADVGRPDFVGGLLVGPGDLVPAISNLLDDAGEPPLAPARLDAVADLERRLWAAPPPPLGTHGSRRGGVVTLRLRGNDGVFEASRSAALSEATAAVYASASASATSARIWGRGVSHDGVERDRVANLSERGRRAAAGHPGPEAFAPHPRLN